MKFNYSLKFLIIGHILLGLIFGFLVMKLIEKREISIFQTNYNQIKTITQNFLKIFKSLNKNCDFFFDGISGGSGSDWAEFRIFCDGYFVPRKNSKATEKKQDLIRILIEGGKYGQNEKNFSFRFKLTDYGFPKNKEFVDYLIKETKPFKIFLEITEKKPEDCHWYK